MEQPLPPGGPMNGNEFPMPPMNGLVGDTFPPHQTLNNGCEEIQSHGGKFLISLYIYYVNFSLTLQRNCLHFILLYWVFIES